MSPIYRSEKPEAVLLDIEGTTTDINFVSKHLFPFIKANIGKYLEEAYDRPETQEMIGRLRESQKSHTDIPPIASPSEGKNAVVTSATNYAQTQMRLKRRISEIKQLQILIWVWGYEKEYLKGHVYDEVTTCMHVWKHHYGIQLYVFSSGMVAAQQLLLCATNHGNCLPLITDFFDSTVGDKSDPQSYRNIAKFIEVSLESILFITDNPKEAKAATDANCNAVIIKRPGNRIRNLEEILNGRQIPIITSFEDIRFN